MSIFDSVSYLPLARAIGWTVVHFLWQGTVIAGCAGLTLGLMRRKSANARYVVCCGVLALMVAAPAITLTTLLSAEPTASGLELSVALSEIAAIAGWQRLNPLLPWIALSWLIGFSLLQSRTLTQWGRAQRLKRNHTRPLPSGLERTVVELCDRVGVPHAVQVMESTMAEVPMLIGWLSPVILVPSAALCGLTQEQLRAVLAHELAHVRRHDTLVNLIQATIESLLFFHPAVWWISDRMRVEREYCCDDVAVQTCGDSLVYAHALSTLENMRDVPAPAVASNGGSLMHRIIRLVGKRPAGMSDRSSSLASFLMTVALAFTLGAAGLALAGGEDEMQEPKEPKEPQRSHATEPTPDKAREPHQAEELRGEIAQREATLRKLERELELRTREGSQDGDRREAEIIEAMEAEVRALQLMTEREVARDRGIERERALANEYLNQARRQEKEILEMLLTEERLLAEQERARTYERELKMLREVQEGAVQEQGQRHSARRSAQEELERALELERRTMEEREIDAMLSLEHTLRAEQEAAERSARGDLETERRELERLREIEHGERDRMRDNERLELERLREGERLELERLREVPLAEIEMKRRAERADALQLEGMSNDDRLRLELAEREAAIERLNREVEALRKQLPKNKSTRAERKELRRRAVEERDKLRDRDRDRGRDDARKARDQGQIF